MEKIENEYLPKTVRKCEQEVDKDIERMSSEQRCRVFIQMNLYRWPVEFFSFMPDEFDGLNNIDRHSHPDFRLLMDKITMATTHFDRSLQWWRDILKKTDEQHKEWWEAQPDSYKLRNGVE